MARVYLDHNATSPLRPAAREALTRALEAANPSSVHAEGRAARTLVEEARSQVAALVGASPRAVTFTSGATESIALALSPEIEIAGRALHSDALIISGVEHPAVRAGGRFPADRVKQIAVDKNGVVDVVALEAMLGRHDAAGRRPLVSVMAANNETGVLQPLQEIASRVHAADGFFHTDAVQIAGRLPFDLAGSGADLISISSHKLGGPQGAGALIARHENVRVPPMQRGGGQERGIRGRHRECRGHRRIRRCGAGGGARSGNGGRASCPPARAAGGRHPRGRAECRVSLGPGAAPAEYFLLRGAEHRRGDRGHRFRS